MQTVKTDVLVAGGGVAGCAAAIAAAREGCRVILAEKMTLCGGLATAGNVVYYLPLCDGYGKQVISGLSEEFLLAALKYGPGEIGNWREPKTFHDRYLALPFNPASLVLALDELLLEAGVDIWFDTVITGAEAVCGALTAAECYNKSGRLRIEAKRFVDATGDADLAVLAGVGFDVGKNLMSGWALEMNPENKPFCLKVNPGCRPEEIVEGISGKTVSQYTLRSREILRESYRKKWQEEGHDRTNTYPVTLSTQQNLRKTRAIRSRFIMNDENAWTDFPDAVGIFQASHDMERCTMWAIPFGALLPEKLDNLLTAGRCIGSRGWCWDNTRLIPMCAQTGNIAGIAAAVSLQEDCTTQTLPAATLQEELASQGHLLNFQQAYGENWQAIAQERLAEKKPRSSGMTH